MILNLSQHPTPPSYSLSQLPLHAEQLCGRPKIEKVAGLPAHGLNAPLSPLLSLEGGGI